MYSPINEPPVNLLSHSKHNFSMKIKKITFFCMIVMILSCDSGNHIQTYYLPKGKLINITSPGMDRQSAPSGFIWDKPDSWMPSDGSAMRLASFAIPYSGGSGDLSVIQLSGIGGGIESNVNRWRQQLNLASQSWIEIEKNIISREGILGLFSVLRIINQKIDSAFLCAIIPIENHTIFVKLSLRPVGLTEVEDDFISFCTSLNIPK